MTCTMQIMKVTMRVIIAIHHKLIHRYLRLNSRKIIPKILKTPQPVALRIKEKSERKKRKFKINSSSI